MLHGVAQGLNLSRNLYIKREKAELEEFDILGSNYETILKLMRFKGNIITIEIDESILSVKAKEVYEKLKDVIYHNQGVWQVFFHITQEVEKYVDDIIQLADEINGMGVYAKLFNYEIKKTGIRLYTAEN